MKRLRFVVIGLAVLASIQGAYVVGRTVQVIREELHRDAEEVEIPEGVCGPRALLALKLQHVLRGIGSEPVGCDDPLDPAEDHDGDGLTGSDETRQLTSDRCPDSDGDGVLDGEDHSPNGVATSWRERVESVAISDRLQAWAKEGTVYVVVEAGEYLDVASPSGKNIVVDEASFTYLQMTEGILPLVRCGDDGYARASDRVFVPGLLYVYSVELWFGGLCSTGDLVFLIDLPFMGPVPVHRTTMWVS